MAMGSRRTFPKVPAAAAVISEHGGANVNTCAPVERLVNQRHGGGAAAAEDNRADEYALRVLPGRIDGRALRCGSSEPRIGMSGLGSGLLGDLGRPLFSLPVETLRRRLVGHSLPPDPSFGGECDVGKNRVFRERGHGVRVRLDGSAGRDAEEAKLRIDRAEPTLRVGSNPGDVVADGPDSPAFLLKMTRRNEHGEIRLATGARESRGDVGFLTLRGLDPEDEHVLGHPPLVPGNVGGNAKGETFFAKQGVAAVTGTIAPDFARFGEVDDVFVGVAWPRDILLTSLERSTY